MSDAWEEIQAVQRKRNSLRERLEKRKKEREGILGSSLTLTSPVGSTDTPAIASVSASLKEDIRPKPEQFTEKLTEDLVKPDPVLEKALLKELSQVTLQLPSLLTDLVASLKSSLKRDVSHKHVSNLLKKFAIQKLITVKDGLKEGDNLLEVTHIEVTKVNAMIAEFFEENNLESFTKDNLKRKREEVQDILEEEDRKEKKDKKEPKADILSLLSMPSTKEKETKKLGEEILDLLSKPTAKERSLTERFRSQGGKQLMEFCPHGTKLECEKNGINDCKKLHFKKILQKHTDESLGDCSFLNTCFHMDTCKYVHYEVDKCQAESDASISCPRPIGRVENTTLYPPQWVQCDLRFLDMTALGKFAVIMADPPWDIHMELPYGTMSDDEMRQLGIPQLQDEGLIFLWVTGRAMELGRECLKLWGYERVDEIIWVKTNQLQRIIRTGRTGHWLNHGKEHCLVGMKGNPKNLNRGLDSDVIVAEVRATSHKPDEIYGMIERVKKSNVSNLENMNPTDFEALLDEILSETESVASDLENVMNDELEVYEDNAENNGLFDIENMDVILEPETENIVPQQDKDSESDDDLPFDHIQKRLQKIS